VVDLSVSKRIWKGLEAKFAINDILAQDLVFYWDNDGSGKLNGFDKNKLITAGGTSEERFKMDNEVFRYKMGYNLSFTLSYKF
jgi:hypothetical protein